MTRAEFISHMQWKVAISAIGASAVRGQPQRTLETARQFMTRLPLETIPVHGAHSFREWLDGQTRALPICWGVARKCLNLFLRDALYNRYLSDAYGLETLEPVLEVPLDSIVAAFLIHEQRRTRCSSALKPWPRLIRLQPKEHLAFQEVAMEIARSRGMARVHVDIIAWPEGRGRPKRQARSAATTAR